MLLSILALFTLLLQEVSAVRFTPFSPCADVCGGMIANTTHSEIVCHDDEFESTAKGRRFRDCVSCELQSTFYDVPHDESDVKWGLCMKFRSNITMRNELDLWVANVQVISR